MTYRGYDRGTPQSDKYMTALIMRNQMNALDDRMENIEFASDYTSFADAVSAIGSDSVTLVTSQTQSLTADSTVPSNIHVVALKGTLFSGPYTITFKSFEASSYQVFDSDVTVVFDPGTIEHDYVEWWATNTTPGTTNMTAAITKALAAYDCTRLLSTTYATTGGHVIRDQRLSGAEIESTILQRLSGDTTLITFDGKGLLEDFTLDGNSLDGSLLLVTSQVGVYYSGQVQRVKQINAGAAISTTNITAATIANPCMITAAGHGLDNGELARIRNATGVQSAANPDLSAINGVYIVANATVNTFTISDNTTGFTAYAGGGTVERASYAMQVGGDTISAHNKICRDLIFDNNYGNIFLGYTNNSTFTDLQMYGATDDWGIFVSNIDAADIRFTNLYIESGIATSWHGMRRLTFTNIKAVYSAAKNWTLPFFYSVGFNNTYGSAGGEVQGTKFFNVNVVRQVNNPTVPIFDTNGYQTTLENIYVEERASTNWSVIRDRGMHQSKLKTVVVQSTNAWDLFHADSTGGYMLDAEEIYYIQGVIGTATWSSTHLPATTTGMCRVIKSNLNQSVAAGNVRNFWFQDIYGDVDLTNVSAPGTVLINIEGTVTDPNLAATIRFSKNMVRLQHIDFFGVYANNVAALAGGLVAGDVYRTATGELMVVY